MSPKNRKQKQQAAEKRRQKEMARKIQITDRQLAEWVEKKASAPATPEEHPVERSLTPGALSIPVVSPSATVPQGDDLWDRFEATDLEGKIVIFLAALEAGEVDSELAFEIFDDLEESLPPDAAGHARYADLVRCLREQAPEVYLKEKKYLHQDMVSHAIADGRWEDVPGLLAAFADEDDLDTYSQVIDQMAYHGREKAILPIMIQAMPVVKASGNLFEWAVDEFGGKIMHLTLWDYLDTSPNPRSDDPALLDATTPYGKWKDGWLERYMPRWTAVKPSAWQAGDFAPTLDADQWEENLNNLFAEFVADRKRAGIPYGRADLAWEPISQALMQQANRAGSGSKSRKGIGKKHKAAPRKLPHSSLIPTFATLDKSLTDLVPFLGGQPYKLAATIELLPAYLHFLAQLGLVHPSEMDQAFQDIHTLSNHIETTLRYYNVDERCIANMLSAWSSENLAARQKDPFLAEARARPMVIQPATPELPRRPGALAAYTFRVTYDRDPQVWRIIELTEKQTLHDLHQIIQKAMDFDDDHPYAFFMSNQAWDEGSEYASLPDRGKTGSRQKKLGELGLRLKQRFLYIFDYGDEHRFEIQLLSINPDAGKADYPRILETHAENPPQYGWDDEDDEEWDDDFGEGEEEEDE